MRNAGLGAFDMLFWLPCLRDLRPHHLYYLNETRVSVFLFSRSEWLYQFYCSQVSLLGNVVFGCVIDEAVCNRHMIPGHISHHLDKNTYSATTPMKHIKTGIT